MTKPVTRDEILDTVRLCEEISARLRAVAQAREAAAEHALQRQESALSQRLAPRGIVLLTGGPE
jgi:hypothetical protein